MHETRVGEVFESNAKSQEAAHRGEQRTVLTFQWVAWGCALYLLPLAIGIPALAVLLWNTGTTVVLQSGTSR